MGRWEVNCGPELVDRDGEGRYRLFIGAELPQPRHRSTEDSDTISRAEMERIGMAAGKGIDPFIAEVGAVRQTWLSWLMALPPDYRDLVRQSVALWWADRVALVVP